MIGHPILDRVDYILAFACFLVALAVYVRTLTPGLLPGDSGEFQTLAYLLGHTHPTGYPVYLALARLSTLLPFGDVAYRVNLFSAMMGALAIAVVYLIGRMLIQHRVLAVVGAALLAISPTIWSQAVIAEIYTAGAAFLGVILLALLWWDQENNPRGLLTAGLLGGLSLGVHMGVALLAPAVLVFCLSHWKRGGKMWVTAILGALSGVLCTLLIFWLIDLNNPTANYFHSIIEPSRSAWGLDARQIDGPLERLLFGWSARQFRSFMFADIGKVTLVQAGNYWGHIPVELSWLAFALSVVGEIVLLARRWRVGLMLLVALVVQWFCLFNYEIWDLYVFYIPSYLLLTVGAVVGMGALVDLGVAGMRRMVSPSQVRWVESALGSAVALLMIMFAVWPVFQPQKEALITAENPFDFNEYPVYDRNLQNIAIATVVDLPENAIVFTDWEMVWPYYYAAHIVEGRRDLTFIETYPADDLDGVADSVVEYVAFHLNNNPILIVEREPALLVAGFTFAPVSYGPTRFMRVMAGE